jgi:branched-chain amino acid transport system ATP-binding protein
MAILEIRNLKKSFGKLVAVNDVSFSMNKEEIISIIGPNGAGKTTLINLISRWIKEDEGVIKFMDKDMKSIGPREAVKMGIARSFQIARMFSGLTVLDNVKLAIASRKGKCMKFLSLFDEDKDITDEAYTILENFNLSKKANFFANELSQGDRKLLDVSIAFSLKPKLLLLDEPTSGVSAAEKTNVMNYIVNMINKNKIGAILIEHDMDVVFNYSSRIIVMNEGRIVADGSPEEIVANVSVKQIMGGK